MLASVLALALVLGTVLSLIWPSFHNDVAVSPAGNPPAIPAVSPAGRGPLSPLAARLQASHPVVVRDATGQATAVYGLPAAEARLLLIPVNRERALPPGYEPPDLGWFGGRLVRTLLRPDLQAMVDAAQREGVELAAISGYRSPDEQELAFESAIWRAMARETSPDGAPIDREEAAKRAARSVAPPGHSQHQLGTALDFSTWEINYALNPAFAATDAGRWLELHAWEFGFVSPYTRNGERRSGYSYEPWHYRWIGGELASVLQRDGYLDHSFLIVDDYLRAAEELLAFEGVP